MQTRQYITDGLRRSVLAALSIMAIASVGNAQPASPNYFPGCQSVSCVQNLGGVSGNSAVANGAAVPNPPANNFGSIRAPGAQAYGYSMWQYLPCANLACDGTSGELSETQVGGAGYQSATTGYIGIAPGSAGGYFQQYYSQASLVGQLGVPVLRSYALSHETLGTAPGYTSECCFYYNSQSISNTLQYYTYTGLSEREFTISYSFDATLLAYHGDEGDYRANASVGAGIFLYDGVVPPGLELELPFGHLMGLHQQTLNGTMADADGYVFGTGSVTFSLLPGQGFWMAAYLSASALPLPGYIISDAAHTMTADFTSGDTDFLIASVPGVQVDQSSVVPEPSTYAMMAAGLLMLGTLGRKRMRRV